MVKLKTVVAIFFVFLFTFFNSQVFAAGVNLPHTIINPDKYLFFSIKRLAEKGILYTKWNKESKTKYLKELTLTRTAELKYVVENNLLGEFQRSTQRLSYQIGILSDYISSNSELSKQKQDTVNLLTGIKKPLEELKRKQIYGSSYWMLVQHSINSIDLNVKKLK